MHDKSTDELLEMFNRGEYREEAFAELSQRGVHMDLGDNYGGGRSRLRLKKVAMPRRDSVGVNWMWRILGVVGAVGMVGVAWHLHQRAELDDWSHKLRERQNTLKNLRKDLAATRQLTLNTEKELEQVRGRQMAAQEGRQKRNQASDRYLELGKQLSETAAALNELNKRRINLVTKVRQAAEGEEIPKLTLRDGKKLESLTIRNATDDAITFKHPNGVVEVDWRNLPQALVTRFQLGDAYRVPSPDEANTPPSPGIDTTTKGTAERLFTLGVTPAAGRELNKALTDRREEAIRLKAKMREFREKAEEERALHRQALRARQPSIHDTLAEEAEAQAKDLKNKLRPLEHRIRELEKIFNQ